MGRHRKHRSSSSISERTNSSGDGRHRVYSNGGSHRERKSAAHLAPVSRMQQIFGFQLSDFNSWSSFVHLMMRPMDPSNLAVARILFGLLMVIDIPQERGLGYADYRWGDPEECRFPLLNFLQVLPIQWMYIVYLAMFCGAVGIMLGFLYRLSCLMFVVTYWYVFLLDKTTWNNHSYLYGLCGILLLFTDANRFWSIDGIIMKRTRNAHIPLWNYCLFRTQFFLVYFIAGLKKLDSDWVGGYSMNDLSRHWVFMPFTYVLTHEQIDLFVVHWGGLLNDLFVGYLLFFDFTRPLAFIICLSFHGMNSQIFAIGMFPYAMIATMPIFSHADWPRRLLRHLPEKLHTVLPLLDPPQASSHCLYPKHLIKPEPQTQANGDRARKRRASSDVTYSSSVARDKPGFYHQVATVGTILYILIQCFLPYSHFLTKGYNNWTNGLYGYSWDMMVHSWSTQHVRITYVDRDTGNVGFLNPDAWTRSKRRWSSHADMLKQYTVCIQDRLRIHNISNVELYFDIWRSLNDRFQQRMFDPREDMVRAKWHPFKASTWLMPLLSELSDWRSELDKIEQSIYNNNTDDTDVVFIADFPGLTLENYVQEDLGQTEITLLQGKVIIELIDQNTNTTLEAGNTMQLPAGQYHNVHTILDSPSCYMYKFVNTTERELARNISEYEMRVAAYNSSRNLSESDPNVTSKEAGANVHPAEEDPQLAALYEQVKQQQERIVSKSNRTVWQRFEDLLLRKYQELHRSFSLTGMAIRSIVTGKPFAQVFNDTIGIEEDSLLEH